MMSTNWREIEVHLNSRRDTADCAPAAQLHCAFDLHLTLLPYRCWDCGDTSQPGSQIGQVRLQVQNNMKEVDSRVAHC